MMLSIFKWRPALLFLLAGVIGMGIESFYYPAALQVAERSSFSLVRTLKETLPLILPLVFLGGFIGGWFWKYAWFRNFSIIISVVIAGFISLETAYRNLYLFFIFSFIILVIMVFGNFDNKNADLYRSLLRKIITPGILLWLYAAYVFYIGCGNGHACESPAPLIPIFFFLLWIGFGILAWIIQAIRRSFGKEEAS